MTWTREFFSVFLLLVGGSSGEYLSGQESHFRFPLHHPSGPVVQVQHYERPISEQQHHPIPVRVNGPYAAREPIYADWELEPSEHHSIPMRVNGPYAVPEAVSGIEAVYTPAIHRGLISRSPVLRVRRSALEHRSFRPMISHRINRIHIPRVRFDRRRQVDAWAQKPEPILPTIQAKEEREEQHQIIPHVQMSDDTVGETSTVLSSATFPTSLMEDINNTLPPVSTPSSQSSFTTLLLRRQREAEDEDETEENGMSNNATGIAGSTDNTGLSEMEIAVIIVCAAVGLLACVIGLIVLARYYWKKLHDDTLGYQGVLQRDSSESSVGTTRIDVKEINAKLEEMDVEPTTNQPILKRQGSGRKSMQAEDTPLLPNGDSTVIGDGGDTNVEIENESKTQVTEKEAVKTTTPDATAPELLRSSCRKASMAIAEVRVEIQSSRLGLSQSDCSISSTTSSNPTYKYGNQVGYMGGYYGYPCDVTYAGGRYDDKPVVTVEPHKTMGTVNVIPTPSLGSESGIEEEVEEVSAGAPAAAAAAAEDVFGTSPPGGDDAFAEADDIPILEEEGDNLNGTDNSTSSVFEMDSDKPDNSNSALHGLQLPPVNRACSLPEKFAGSEGSGDGQDDATNQGGLGAGGLVDGAAAVTVSGWGNTADKMMGGAGGDFHGSLPGIHINVTPTSGIAACPVAENIPEATAKEGPERMRIDS